MPQFGVFVSKILNLLIFLGVLTALPIVAQSGPEECHPYVPLESQQDPNFLAMKGVACFENGNFLQALSFYRQAYHISKSPVLKGGIGRCLQELGFPDLARQYFLDYLQSESKDSEGHARISQRLEVVDARLRENAKTTQFRTSPSGARVYFVIEGEHWEEIGQTPLTLRLLPGEYRVVLRQEDFQTREFALDVQSDDPLPDTIELVPQSVGLQQEFEWRKRGVFTMVSSSPFLAVGGAMLILGEFREGSADRYEVGHPNYDVTRQRDLEQEASRYRTVGLTSSAIGASLLIAGIVLYVVGSSGDNFEATPEGVSLRF